MLTPVSGTGQALPDAIIPALKPFAPMFQARTWTKVQVLLVGAVLATHRRTVTSTLRVMGLSDDKASRVTTTFSTALNGHPSN